MMWKHIWCKAVAGMDRNDAADVAFKSGYKFMSFNGMVFFLEKRKTTSGGYGVMIHETGILAEELE